MPAPTHLGPSYSCAGRLSATEEVICNDAELSAYDRAMAWAWTRKWKSSVAEWMGQRAWLAKRNDCGLRRDCILAAYHEWIGGLDVLHEIGPTFERIGRVNNHGDDLMLGSLQSPTGSVKPLGDFGTLSVHPLGGDWFLFQIVASHAYDPHDGLGANVSTAEAVGLVHLSKRIGVWVSEPDSSNSCAVQLTRLSASRWRVVEGVGGCSGLGATLTGDYSKQ